MAYAVGVAVFREGIKHIVSRLIEGDRLMLPYGREMYIAGSSNPVRLTRRPLDDRLGITGWKNLTTRLTGMKHNVFFTLNSKSKVALKKKIISGQWYPL